MEVNTSNSPGAPPEGPGTEGAEVLTPRRQWGRTAVYALCLTGAVLTVQLVVVPHAYAAGDGTTGTLDAWEDGVTLVITWLKRFWFAVLAAEVLAVISFLVAFFTQNWFPSLYQKFQGEWMKWAVIYGVVAHPVLGMLYGALEAAKGGFK